MQVAFVCVQNAGRSQMAAAFARQEVAERGLDVEVVSGGTHPAEDVHPEVVETMAELGIDISDQEPEHVSEDRLEACAVVATMGCSTLTLDADTDVRDWGLPDPEGRDPDAVRDIRDEVRERVRALFDDLDAETVDGTALDAGS